MCISIITNSCVKNFKKMWVRMQGYLQTLQLQGGYQKMSKINRNVLMIKSHMAAKAQITDTEKHLGMIQTGECLQTANNQMFLC